MMGFCTCTVVDISKLGIYGHGFAVSSAVALGRVTLWY